MIPYEPALIPQAAFWIISPPWSFFREQSHHLPSIVVISVSDSFLNGYLYSIQLVVPLAHHLLVKWNLRWLVKCEHAGQDMNQWDKESITQRMQHTIFSRWPIFFLRFALLYTVNIIIYQFKRNNFLGEQSKEKTTSNQKINTKESKRRISLFLSR